MNKATWQDAILLIEDQRFYKHWGIDPIATMRALVVNIRYGRRAQGGSTITQQLARMLYLNNRKTISRKIKEAIIAVCLEVTHTKQWILDKYCARMYMGQGGHGFPVIGFEAASFYYFGCKASYLTSAQLAALVGMIKGPNLYRLDSPEGVSRRIFVLSRMLDAKMISQTEFIEASRELL